MVEVAEIRPENNIRIGENNSSTQLLKAGLYDFDADRGLIRVFDGKAEVQVAGQHIELKSGQQVALSLAGKLKERKFDKKTHMDDFYRWASLRSSYLAEANVDEARTYAGGTGYSPGLWSGDGWYWDPGFDAYTFIPDDGIFFDPFGWGFYSPWFAFGAPYFGYGYGGYGYGRYGYGGVGILDTSGRVTIQPTPPVDRASGSIAHAYHVSGGASAALAAPALSAAEGSVEVLAVVGSAAADSTEAAGFHGGGGGGGGHR